MSEPGQDSGATSSGPSETGPSETSSASGSGSEPQSGAYEAPPIEQTSEPAQPSQGHEYGGYGQPPGYAAPAGYPPPGYPQPDYGQPGPPPSYPQPGYPPQDFQPGGYPPPAGYPPPGFGAPGYPGAQYGTPPPPYGAPSGYPPAGYGSPYGDAPSSTNPLAIASLVASAIGVLCGIGSIIGIVLGIVALNQIKQKNQGGHGLAIAGIAVGAVSLVLSMVLAITMFSPNT